MDIETARSALKEAADCLDEDQFEALEYLVSLFEPYKGDDPAEAMTRSPQAAHCANCMLPIQAMFAPAPLNRVARTMTRLAQCPRCFSTNILLGKSPLMG